METTLIIGVITFLFTALLTISGVGAAFILIPVFVALGVEVHQAMATSLLLNAIAMACASARFLQKKMVVFSVALPMLIMGSLTSPICARLSNFIDRTPLLWMFAAFCAVAGAMMFFFSTQSKEQVIPRSRLIKIGLAIGFMAGIGGGLLGVGGGNLLVAVLVWIGLEPKKASASTAFIVIFLSFAGFLGHIGTGLAEMNLTIISAACAVAGALVGSWLLTEILSTHQVRRIIGIVLMCIAAKVVWDLLH